VKNLSPECCYFSICKDAQNAPSCWKVREEAFSAVAIPVTKHHVFSIPTAQLIFSLPLEKKVTNSNSQ
jgi:hypothetical protein